MKTILLTENDINDIVLETIELLKLQQERIRKTDVLGNVFTKPLIDEGLIMSHNIKNVSMVLRNYNIRQYGITFTKDYFYRYSRPNDEGELISPTTFYLTFHYGMTKITEKEYNALLKLIDNLGWYASLTNVSGKDYQYSTLQKFDKFFVRFEPKFDVVLLPSDLPDKLYHITRAELLDKIKKIGIQPKDGSMFTNHPERVYLFVDKPDNWREYAENFKNGKNNNSDYILLSVDTTKLSNITNFYIDQNSNFIRACYVLEPIPPYAIELADA